MTTVPCETNLELLPSFSSHEHRKIRILFVFPDGNLSNNPSLSAITSLLSNLGHVITVRCAKNPFAQSPNPNVRILTFSHRWQERFRTLSKRPITWALGRRLAVLMPAVDPAIDVVVGVDRQGIIEGLAFAEKLSAALVYLSYELCFAAECAAPYKALEREAASRACLAVSQDSLRARLLSQETGISPEKILKVPVAGTGTQGGEKGYWLHRELGIPASSRVAIMAGSHQDWTLSRQLVASLADWPPDWVLVMHHRYGILPDWLRDAHSRMRGRLYISKGGLLTMAELGRVLRSADIGIGLYHPTYDSIYDGKNIASIGLSSGKIATYLQHGVPVLVNEIGEMALCVRENGLGLVVREVSEIPKLLGGFRSESARERCLAFFRQRLDTALSISTLEASLLNCVVEQRKIARRK